MNKTLKNSIQFVLFLGFGVLLFWLVYRDTNWSDLVAGLKNVNYWWFIPIVVAGLFSHVSRAIRWNMMIEPLGYKTRFWNTFFAVMTGYFANLAIPRLGEVARCGVVSKYDKVPISKVLGTMITERVIDVLSLLLVVVIAIFVESGFFSDFLQQNPGIGEKVDSLLNPLPIIIAIAAVALFIVLFFLILKGKFDKIRLFLKLKTLARNLYDGLFSVRKVRKKFWFLFHSIFIWILYYLMMAFAFPAFGFTSHIGPSAALMVFVAGSFGMIAPAPNGMGAYHFMVIQSLLIFGIVKEDAAVFAFVVHGLQRLMLLGAGLISLIALPLINKIPAGSTSSENA